MNHIEEFKQVSEACAAAMEAMQALVKVEKTSDEGYFAQMHKQSKVSSALFEVLLNLQILQIKLAEAKKSFAHHEATDEWLFFQSALRNDVFRWKEEGGPEEKVAQVSDACVALERLYDELKKRLAAMDG